MSRHGDDVRRVRRTRFEIACAGKHRFDSYTLAVAVALRSRRGRVSNRAAYKCGHCDGYHLGADRGRVNKKRRLAHRRAKEASNAM